MPKYKISLRKGIYGTRQFYSEVVDCSYSQAWQAVRDKADELGVAGGCHMRVETIRNTQDESKAVRCAKSGRLATR